MTDWMESQREWEKVQLAKLAIMLNRWKTDPAGSVEQIPKDISAAGRNLGAMTGGFLGDVSSMVPGSQQSIGGQAPTSEDLVTKFGEREHFSYWPSMFAAPGPGEFKAAAKALMGLGKDLGGGVALAQSLFHGTPHKFSKFELEKIGTGEGAQAYGHGLYFAESPGVAKSYQNMLGKSAEVSLDGKPWEPAATIKDMALDMGRLHGKEAAVKYFDEFGGQNARARKAIEEFDYSRFKTEPGSHLYEVDIPDETIGKMLDWDAPLSEQPELLKTLEGLGVDVADNPLMRAATPPLQVKGREAYSRLAKQLGSEEAASRALNEAGIPGIRFYDGASRNTAGGRIMGVEKTGGKFKAKIEIPSNNRLQGSPQTITWSKPYDTEAEALAWANKKIDTGTRNIVVFNPDDIKSVKRDGELVYKAGRAKKAADEEFIQVYHGFPTDALEGVQKHGILSSGGRARGATFATPKPDIAFAYIEKGGEKSLKGATRRPLVPDNERALAVIRIPKSWYKKHMVQERRGGLTPEVGFDTDIPPEFIQDIVVGDRKAVYALPTTELPKKSKLEETIKLIDKY